MAVKTKKNVKETSLRTPKAKSKLGLSVPRIGMPHGEFVRGDSEKRADLDSVIGVSGQGGQTTQSDVPGLSSETGYAGKAGQSKQSGASSRTSVAGQTGMAGRSAQYTSTSDIEESVTIEDIADIPVLLKPESEFLATAAAGELDHFTHPSQTGQTATTTQPAHTSQTEVTGSTPSFTLSFPPVTTEMPTAFAPVFRGKSAQIFDVLYDLTLGAPSPQRSVRIRKGELMRRAGIGSRNTFTANIDFLIKSGFISQTVIAGESDGNEFEILQVPANTGQTGQTSITTQRTSPSTRTNTVPAVDRIHAFIQKLENACTELTGNSLTEEDRAALENLAEIVINAAAKNPEIGQNGQTLIALAVKQLGAEK